MADNKYKEFRNYMVNELGITRQDIEAWTKQSTANEIEKILSGLDVKEMVSGAIKRCAYDAVNSGGYGRGVELRNALAKEIADKMLLEIKFKAS